MGIKDQKFYADFKMGQFTFVACFFQKLKFFGGKITSPLKIDLLALTFDRSKLTPFFAKY
jgi:hypothetical protein